MKRVGVALIAVLFVLSMVGCGGGGGKQVTQEEAQKGFAVAFGSFFMGMMSASMGSGAEGVEMSEEGDEFIFDKFDVSEIAAGMETEYTTMSGTIGEKDGGMIADLTLEGGPVTSLQFEIGEELDLENASEIEATINGTKMTISTADLSGGMGM
jgi:cell division GTPase FtsZ